MTYNEKYLNAFSNRHLANVPLAQRAICENVLRTATQDDQFEFMKACNELIGARSDRWDWAELAVMLTLYVNGEIEHLHALPDIWNEGLLGISYGLHSVGYDLERWLTAERFVMQSRFTRPTIWRRTSKVQRWQRRPFRFEFNAVCNYDRLRLSQRSVEILRIPTQYE